MPKFLDENSLQAVKTYVERKFNDLPEPMVFQGSVGTGGTKTWDNYATGAKVGWTYKVITDHATTPICKVGDSIIYKGNNEWVVIPSGDEPSGTVTSVNAAGAANSHIQVSNGPITDRGSLTIGVEVGYSIPSNQKQQEWDGVSSKSTVSASGTGTSTTPISYITIDGVEYQIVPSSASTIAWGYITGDITSQTDLQTALSGKQNSLSTVQMDAANSGITTQKVSDYDTHLINSNIHVTAEDKTNWNAKQNALTFDNTPTQGSSNPVTSGGVYTICQTIEETAAGKCKSYVIDTQSQIIGTKDSSDNYTNVTAITGVTLSDLKVGDQIFIKQLEVPDYWISALVYVGDVLSSVSLNKMETSKVNLTPYDTHINNSTAHVTAADKTNWNSKLAKSEVPNHQASTIVVRDAVTNVNGKALTSFHAENVTINGYEAIRIFTSGLESLTLEQASTYMKAQTGSEFVPTYNYDNPLNSYLLFANGKMYKPQWDSSYGLVLYYMTTIGKTTLYKHTVPIYIGSLVFYNNISTPFDFNNPTVLFIPFVRAIYGISFFVFSIGINLTTKQVTILYLDSTNTIRSDTFDGTTLTDTVTQY